MTDTDAAYIAGLLDGDGAISLSLSTKSNGDRYIKHQVSIVIKEKWVLEWVQSVAPGAGISKRTDTRKNHQDTYHLYWAGSKTIRELLVAIIPYLKIKKEHATLMLAYLQTVKGKGYRHTEDELFLRRELAYEMGIVNQRGR